MRATDVDASATGCARPGGRHAGVVGGRAKESRAASRLPPVARRGASACGGGTLWARARSELLGRIVERHHADARRAALSRSGARGAARERDPDLPRASARTGAAEGGGTPEPDRCARGRSGKHLRTAARIESLVLHSPIALRGTTMAK